MKRKYAMFKHHLEALRETKSKLTLPKCLAPTVRIYDNLEHHMHRLFNLNAVIETLSKGLARDEERKLELELQHDVYRVAGMVVDAYLVVFSVGFAIHIAEMNFAGAFADAAGHLVGSSVAHTAASGGGDTRSGQGSSVLRWGAGVLGSGTGAGGLEVLRDSQDVSVLRRTINGADVAMPEHELEVDGQALSFLPPQSEPGSAIVE